MQSSNIRHEIAWTILLRQTSPPYPLHVTRQRRAYADSIPYITEIHALIKDNLPFSLSSHLLALPTQQQLGRIATAHHITKLRHFGWRS